MVEKISKKILEYMKSKDVDIVGDTEEIVYFGITKLVEEIPKFIITIIIFLYLGLIKEYCILLISQMIYKTYIGGAHARTNLICTISSLSIFILNIFLAKILIYTDYIMYAIYFLMYIFGMYVISKYAPADTEEIPIINKELRKSLKIKAYIAINVMYLICIIALTLFKVPFSIINICIFNIFITNIFATKIIYKIFKCNYGYKGGNEYESYN